MVCFFLDFRNTPSPQAAASRDDPTESARTNLIFVLRTSPPFSALSPRLDFSVLFHPSVFGHRALVFPRIPLPIPSLHPNLPFSRS